MTSSAGDYVKATVEGENTRAFIITHLLPDTAYDIKLQAFTVGSASDFSAILTHKTQSMYCYCITDIVLYFLTLYLVDLKFTFLFKQDFSKTFKKSQATFIKCVLKMLSRILCRSHVVTTP